MTPDEVVEQLKKIGIEISRPTLSRYEKQTLIPIPERGSLGRAGGRWTNYPESTVEEAYAAWNLMHGDYGDEVLKGLFGGKMPELNPITVSAVRDIYYARYLFKLGDVKGSELIIQRNPYGLPNNKLWVDVIMGKTSKRSIKMSMSSFISGFTDLWEKEIEKAKEKILGN